METRPELDPIPSLLSSDCESRLNPEANETREYSVVSTKSLGNQAAESSEVESLSVHEEDRRNECSTSSRMNSDAADPETSSIDDEGPGIVESGEPESPSTEGQDNSMKKAKKKTEPKQSVGNPATSLSLPEQLLKTRR